MTYSIEQLKTMCAADIAKCSPRHVESVIEELIETAVSLAEREQAQSLSDVLDLVEDSHI